MILVDGRLSYSRSLNPCSQLSEASKVLLETFHWTPFVSLRIDGLRWLDRKRTLGLKEEDIRSRSPTTVQLNNKQPH